MCTLLLFLLLLLLLYFTVHKSMRIQRQNGKKNELCTEGTPEMDTGALGYRKEQFDFIGRCTHLAHGHT